MTHRSLEEGEPSDLPQAFSLGTSAGVSFFSLEPFPGLPLRPRLPTVSSLTAPSLQGRHHGVLPVASPPRDPLDDGGGLLHIHGGGGAEAHALQGPRLLYRPLVEALHFGHVIVEGLDCAGQRETSFI